MKKLSFENGDTMPVVGLGTWKATGTEIKKTIKEAVHMGYRHIDTATIYGNEKEIGDALQELFADRVVTRDELFITSKLWNNAHHPEDVLPALQESLDRLRLKYLDLYLIHWPIAFKHGVMSPENASDYVSLEEVPIAETWKKFEQAKQQGLAKHIGVSNFSVTKLKDLLGKAKLQPEVNQVELQPMLQQSDLINYCNENQILVTAYSPLGSGDRSEAMKSGDEPNLFEIPAIQNIAEKHSVHPAAVLVAWHVNRGTSVIPKSTNPDHMKSNLQAANLVLDSEDMETIAALDRNYRFITGKFFECPEKGYVNVYDE